MSSPRRGADADLPLIARRPPRLVDRLHGGVPVLGEDSLQEGRPALIEAGAGRYDLFSGALCEEILSYSSVSYNSARLNQSSPFANAAQSRLDGTMTKKARKRTA